MFDTICTLPLTSDLFAQSLHPTEPILSVGLSSGHVHTFRLPAVASDSSEDGTSASETGFGQIETTWRTRRHKGSCRCVDFSHDGDVLFSGGTDGLVKAASTRTGQVSSKIAIVRDRYVHSATRISTRAYNVENDPDIVLSPNSDVDAPSLLHALTPQTLLLATDSSALHLYDLRENSFSGSKPQQTHHPHDDYVSSLTPLPPSDTSTSGFSKQWVTTGGSTLAVTDLRRGVLVRSEDQEEELLSSVFVGGLSAKPGRSNGEKVLVGGAGGVLTLWERGVWDDQDERITVDRGTAGGESLDTIAILPDDVGPGGKMVAVGLGDGRVKFVKLGSNKDVGEVRHDEVESVVSLGFDVGGRMISGGGQIIKVWHEKTEDEDEERDGVAAKRNGASDSDRSGSDTDGSDGSEEQQKDRRRKKRRKRNRGKDLEGRQDVLAFKGMD